MGQPTLGRQGHWGRTPPEPEVPHHPSRVVRLSATLVRVAMLPAALVALDAPSPLEVAFELAVDASNPTETCFESAVDRSVLTLRALESAVLMSTPADTLLESAVEMVPEVPVLTATESTAEMVPDSETALESVVETFVLSLRAFESATLACVPAETPLESATD